VVEQDFKDMIRVKVNVSLCYYAHAATSINLLDICQHVGDIFHAHRQRVSGNCIYQNVLKHTMRYLDLLTKLPRHQVMVYQTKAVTSTKALCGLQG